MKASIRRPYPFLLAALMSAAPLAAHALDITVTKTSDSQDGACDSDCSLREAIIKANASSGSHRIRLAAGTYQLSIAPPFDEDGNIADEDFNMHGDLDVRSSLTISGAGSGQTFIDGGSRDRLFEVFPDAKLTLHYLTLRNGRHSYDGGAIRNEGEVYVSDADFQQNRAANAWSGVRGGAIANYAALTLVRTRFLANQAGAGDTSWSLGGALHNEGSMLVRDAEFRGNSATTDDWISSGGAVFNIGVADIARALFVDNDSGEGNGAAIANESGGELTLRNATVSGNRASRPHLVGIVSNGSYSPYQPNYPEPAEVPSMHLANVTIAANRAEIGLLNFGTLRVRNSLIMATQSDLSDPDYSTNCHNSGAQATLQASGMLLGQNGSNCVADLARVADALAFTTVMYPLADNNGTLQTHALRRGSPAVDAAIGSCSSDDQRGASRPRDGNGDGVAVCDLGAYERPKF